MKIKLLQFAVFVSCISMLTTSCKKEALDSSNFSKNNGVKIVSPPPRVQLGSPSSKIIAKAGATSKLDEFSNYLSKKIAGAKANGNAVVPSECGPTAFDKVIEKYISKFGPLEFALYNEYVAINQLATIIDMTKQYFGAKGQYTPIVVKNQKNLEDFWKMYNEVRINGEHNSTLNDREKIAEVYVLFAGLSPEEAYLIADEIIAINKESEVFIETPLLSFDAFASPDNLIVIGDGIIQGLSETGVESRVVIGGVVSHEWGHQIQFNNSKKWFGYEFEGWPFTAEFTRFTEMEADCFSGYYLTHNKGAAYNWKKIAQFLYLFYTIGDCGFTSPGHHGTPYQRFAASRLGFLIAELTFPRSKVLSADQVHQLYSVGYECIIKNSITSQQALASLKTDELKAMFRKILLHRLELQSIANGRFSKSIIENL
ncbi:MAG TPA: hypothetical protein VF540_00225 [Segetibacter sp.]